MGGSVHNRVSAGRTGKVGPAATRWIALLALLVPSPSLSAQSTEAAEWFETRIRPLLSDQCFACHGPKSQTARLDLSTEAGVLKGGQNGPVVVKGHPENSRLIQVVGYQEKVKMPPAGKLTEQQISNLTAWVKMGASWPPEKNALSSVPVHEAGTEKGKYSKEQEAFWSFQPVKAQTPPAVKSNAWAKTPVDRFILAKLEKEGLEPAEPADKLALLRRATFDLTGLPPTEKEIADFLSDDSPQGFDKVFERLLASARYGERWGRHWLDVARYGDSTGGDEDYKNPHAWRYRDYVIQAFNRNLPYDQFLMEQLAGDMLPSEKPGEVNVDGIVATGFLALGPKMLSEQDKPKVFYDIVDEQIDVTSRAVMGLTIACARCHDHKFDPIPTKDYYSLASIFASTKQLSKLEGITSQLYFAPLVPKEVAESYEQYQKKIAAKKEAIDEIVDAETKRYAARFRPRLADYMIAARGVYAGGRSADELARENGLDLAVLEKWVKYLKPSDEVRPNLLRWHAVTESTVHDVAREYQAQFEASAQEREEALAKWKEQVATALKEKAPPPEKPKFQAGKNRFYSEVALDKGPLSPPEKDAEQAYSKESKERLVSLREEMEELKKGSPPEPPMACAVAEGQVVQQHVLIRGNTKSLGPEVPKGFPRVLAGDQQPAITQGSGRLQLARWLADPSHPLTARVMVNRIWQWHFGEGLVRTPSNFGLMGERPTHPDLLDYLAGQFVKSGWSIKAMHRLIMSSNTYQMSSQVSQKKMAVDPSNRFWSHFNSRRLDVEELRDALLTLDGSLDLKMGGTLQSGSGYEPENDAVLRVSLDPDTSRRRTVYLPLRRSNLPPLLTLFDFGDASATSETRISTNVAPQALFMMNSKFVAERSKSFAKFLLADVNSSDERRIERSYLLILSRKPAPREMEAALAYIRSLEQRDNLGAEAAVKAWQSYCRILMASNEFIFVD
jgi:cytochrome c553